MDLQTLNVSIPAAECVVVEYPGLVRNPDRALTTLGGTNAIAAAVDSKSNYLKLKHRPEDHLSHPLYAERNEATRLLLRISRPVQRQPQPPQTQHPSTGSGPHPQPPSPSTGPSPSTETPALPALPAPPTTDSSHATPNPAPPTNTVTARVVARVTSSFRFSGLADFAFLPTDPLFASHAAREGLPYDQRPDKAEPSRAAQPFLLVPQLFSWLDLPQDYAYKQPAVRIVKAGRTEPTWGDAPNISFYAEGVPPPVAAAGTAAAPAPPPQPDIGVPAAAGGGDGPAAPPAADGTAGAAAAGPDARLCRLLETEVSRLLASRPVWGLELMRERVAACPAVAAAGATGGGDAAAVERVVQRLCYRFKTGPWRGLFLRRGYDPRVDPEARRYQAIAYSLPNNWYRHLLRAGALQQAQAAEAAGGGGGDGAAGAGGGAAPAPAAVPTMDDLHNFRALPTTHTVVLQLCDLGLPEAQQALRDAAAGGAGGAAAPSKCSEKNGWLSHGALQAVQAAVQQRFQALMDRLAPPGAATSGAAGTPAGAAGGAGGGDVEMAEAGGAGAAAGGGRDALGSLMQQMNLGGGGGDAVAAELAGLFGEEDEEEGAGPAGGGGGREERMAGAGGAREGRGGRRGGGGEGEGEEGHEDEEAEDSAYESEGSAYESEGSAYESEYEMGDVGDEEEEEGGEEYGTAFGPGPLRPGGRFDMYGRVDVPYDGGLPGEGEGQAEEDEEEGEY